MKCPLCCDKVFVSKNELLQHLAFVSENLYCPTCNSKCSSLSHLIEHLTLENCQVEESNETIITFDINTASEEIENVIEYSQCNLEELDNTKLDSIGNVEHHNNITDPLQPDVKLDDEEDGSDISRMYVELLSKQLTKPCLQTQELKLVKDNGVSRYVIVTNDNSSLSAENAVITKQNNDGTISMTTLKDMTLDPDTVITQETDPEDQAELYSCNTCGVSFHSVIEHIQNYHNDQDVVVEEPMEDANGEMICSPPPVPGYTEEIVDERQATRRMITDTGDIIETQDLKIEPNIDDAKMPVEKKPPNRRYERLEKCDSIVKDIKPPNEAMVANQGPYHKVLVKEMQTTEGENVKIFHCISCNIYVASLDEFKSQPCRVLKCKCDHCPVSYDNSKSLSAHLKIHKKQIAAKALAALPANAADGDSKATSPFECEICATVFPTNKSLKLHKRMHDPVKVRPIDQLMKTEGNEQNGDVFLCDICNKLIPVDYTTIHQNSHKNTVKYHCDICNRKFTSKEYLDMHLTVHTTDKAVVNDKNDKSLPYVCSFCDRRFARPHEKVKHERIHTGEKPHSCQICGKSFRVSYCLTLHMRTHTGARPYACRHCGKRFKAHSVYSHHLMTHSEVRAYKCPYCPKAFKTAVQLAGHKNSHTKPFSCQHCNRPFASLYAVRVHTETHARENNLKFSCSLCGASYARAFALKDHVKQVHKQDVEAVDNTQTVPMKESDWLSNEIETEEIEMSKDMPHEINELAISGAELIVP